MEQQLIAEPEQDNAAPARPGGAPRPAAQPGPPQPQQTQAAAQPPQASLQLGSSSCPAFAPHTPPSSLPRGSGGAHPNTQQ